MRGKEEKRKEKKMKFPFLKRKNGVANLTGRDERTSKKVEGGHKTDKNELKAGFGLVREGRGGVEAFFYDPLYSLLS